MVESLAPDLNQEISDQLKAEFAAKLAANSPAPSVIMPPAQGPGIMDRFKSAVGLGGPTAPPPIEPAAAPVSSPTQGAIEDGTASPLMMGGRPTYHKGSWDYSRYPISTPTTEAEVKGLEGMNEAIKARDMKQATGDMLQSELYAQQARDLENQRVDQMLLQQKRQEQTDAMRNKSDDIMQKAAAKQIDPNRMFANQGAGQRFMMMLGGAMGGWLSAYSGGPNQFIEGINRAQDQDIAAQKEDIAQNWRKHEGSVNALHALEKEFGDKGVAEQTLRAMQLQAFQNQANSLASSTKSEMVQANQKVLDESLKAQMVNILKQRDVAAHTMPYVENAGGGKPQVDSKLVVRLPGGGTRIAPNEPAQAAATKAINSVSQVKAVYAEAQEYRKKAYEAWKNNDVKGLAVANDHLQFLNNRRASKESMAEEQGVLREPEFARAMDQMDFSHIDWKPGMKGRTNDQIQNAIEYWDRQGQATVDAYAPETAVSGYAQAPSGGIKPAQAFLGQAKNPKKFTRPSSFQAAK